ncbi:chromosome partitioning protein [Paraburkholderia sp. HC6.4b]|uniref:AAA family ATPase n=1 Tax=unclassified Paraburkholderia TaxID=2615204 RepID=UPI0017E72529|nr:MULTISPECIES: AAA family ATPase [unclassified Paraburkholderia]MBB5409364.1 chromosome partitioning protein [Paraburkholderia sp. HC6.4b]MBB5451092.1 chromosome partitioning protein [Paraburkholderia sp. Kb1A]
MNASTLLATKLPPALDFAASMDTLSDVAERAAGVLNQIRDRMLEPYPRKRPPTFTSAQVANLCGLEKLRFQYLTTKGDLPAGTSVGNGKSKTFTLDETLRYIRAAGNRPARPQNAPGKVVTVANFKGGVAKTTTAVSLAQGLTLRGRKVLVIDCDPQGTATQLCGFSPETEIGEERTLMPLIYGDETGLDYAIQETYWQDLDLIPASSGLFSAEFHIPGKLASDHEFAFWNILNQGLVDIKDRYDAIIVDTPPSLSYLTINALMAADGLLMPCPPEGLDFASSTQFWFLFTEMARHVPAMRETKNFDFVNVVLTKSKNDDLSGVVRGWLQKAYGDRVLPYEIPESVVPKSASAQLSTVYDLTKPEGSVAAYTRFKDPMDQLVRHIDSQFVQAWSSSQMEV